MSPIFGFHFLEDGIFTYATFKIMMDIKLDMAREIRFGVGNRLSLADKAFKLRGKA